MRQTHDCRFGHHATYLAAKIDRLDLLEKLFGSVYIPQGVFDELTSNSAYSDEAARIGSCHFIQVKQTDRNSVSQFQDRTGLDLSESEAIVLTNELHAELTLIDERNARSIAKQLGLTIMSTVGILGLSVRKGFLTTDDIRHYIKIFKENNRHIDELLFKNLLESV